jgi:hypothetical protein
MRNRNPDNPDGNSHAISDCAARVQGADPVPLERENPDNPDTHARENKIPESYFFSLSALSFRARVSGSSGSSDEWFGCGRAPRIA